MSERDVVLAAIVATLAAAAAVAVPWWVVGVVAVVAVIVRTPVAVVAVVAVFVSGAASRAEAGLDVRPGPVAAVATLVTDPEPRPGGLVVEVRVAGHRVRAFVGSESARALGDALAGEEGVVTGRVGRLDGPWEWRASRHLAGRLTIRSLRRAGPGAWWWRGANWVHRTVAAGLGSFDRDERALFEGIVFGDDRDESDLDRLRFRAAGTAHLMAVSGQNVAFVLVAAGPLLRRCRLGWRWPVTLLLLAGFAVVTRLEPSVIRAVAMAAVAATAARWGRYASGGRVVSAAVVGVVCVDPLLVWSVGFRLSVAACVALVTLARPLARRIPGPRWLAEALAVTLAAEAGTAILLVGIGGSVPVLGPVANLLAVPVAGWLMVWGVVTAPVAGLVGGEVSVLLGMPSRGMVEWVAAVTGRFADPGLPRLGVVGAVAFTVAVVAVAVGQDDRSRTVRRALGVAAVLAAMTVGADALHLVGSASCAVDGRGLRVRSDGGSTILVIGAGAVEGDVLGSLLQCRRGRVDVVVVTGGGSTAATIVHDLRSIADVGVVLARRPGEIRDARQLAPGPIEVGTIEVDPGEAQASG